MCCNQRVDKLRDMPAAVAIAISLLAALVVGLALEAPTSSSGASLEQQSEPGPGFVAQRGRARSTPVPVPFHGVVTQTPLGPTDSNRMREGAVGTMRFAISWRSVESGDRGSYDFSEPDRQMREIVSAGVTPFPFVFGTPGWAGDERIGTVIGTPQGRQAWHDLIVALAEHYAPGSDFWASSYLPDAGVPIWQIGNEPNLISVWGGQPRPRGYAALLRIGANAVRSVDPGAQIAMAGLPPGTKGPDGWDYLGRLLKIKGLGSYFDFIAPHPYSSKLRGVFSKLGRFRAVLRHHRLGSKRMLITELGWMAGGRKDHDLRRSAHGQARILKHAYSRLARRRGALRLSGVFWYAWRDRGRGEKLCSFCSHSGLFTAKERPKQSWTAFERSARTLRG